MINFSDLKELAGQLNCLKVINTQEQCSAINCIKIEQIDSKLTKFTTYEPSVGVYERIVYEKNPNCLGDPGDVYLVDAVEFIEMINTFAKTNCNILCITEEEGMLCYSDIYLDEEYKVQYSSKDYMTLYPGDIEDFNPPLLSDSELIGYCPEESFTNLCKTISGTGQFNDANESYKATVNNAGRSIMLNTSIDKLELFSTSKNLSVLYTLKVPASFEKDERLNIEGRHFNRLKQFTPEKEPVEFYLMMHIETRIENDIEEEYYHPWIGFKSKYNFTACRLVEPSQSLTNYYEQFNKAKELDFVSRELNRYSLGHAFTRLKSKSKGGQLYVLFLDDSESHPPVFILKDANLFITPTEHKVPITDTDNQPFISFAYTLDELESILSILKGYIDDTVQTKHPLMTIELGILKRTFNGIDYPLFITFIYPTTAKNEIMLMAQPMDGLKFIAPANDVTYEQTVETE